MTHLHELQDLAWAIAEDKGFHGEGEGDERDRGTILALIHSEVSEALEADREGNDDLYAEELADVVIRLLDHAETENIDLEKEVERKMTINEQREHKHGKRY